MDDNGCAMSPNYPSLYGNDESCTIRVDIAAIGPLNVESFQTEHHYDKLKLNGRSYSGSQGPNNVVPSGDITWSSDYSVKRSGWKICAGSTASSTSTVHTTTTTTSTTATTSTTTGTTTLVSTTATTTSTVTSTLQLIDGLTIKESAVYNPQLASYWDLDHCGKASNNHNWGWCWNGAFGCQSLVDVDASVCMSGKAGLNFSYTLARVDLCTFGYYAQYVCRP